MKPEGWLSPEEATELENLARGRNVLEVGAWLGLSTVTMARVATRLVSVDHHKGSAEHQQNGPCFDPTLVNRFGEVDTLPRFRANLKQNRVLERVSIVVAMFEEIAPFLAPASFDLVFIDADHSTRAVVRHGLLAAELVASGGVLAFHDANWPTVRSGLQDFAIELAWSLQPREVGSLAIFQFPEGE